MAQIDQTPYSLHEYFPADCHVERNPMTISEIQILLWIIATTTTKAQKCSLSVMIRWRLVAPHEGRKKQIDKLIVARGECNHSLRINKLMRCKREKQTKWKRKLSTLFRINVYLHTGYRFYNYTWYAHYTFLFVIIILFEIDFHL